MVKALFLGILLTAAYIGFLSAAPSPRGSDTSDDPEEDPAVRSERSANLSHVTGAARKIQMFVKNRHLQILPGGTVNGTTDDTSPYTILQRTTIGIGQMRIQGVATCQYLCMDDCGLLYGSMVFGDECIFNETIEATNYNKYSSNKYSNDRRTFYLALNRRGQPRKVMIKASQQLGKLSSYTRVLTRTVMPEHPMRHHNHHQCPVGVPYHHDQQSNDPPRCRKKKKKKKKKRKLNGNENDYEPKRFNRIGGLKCKNIETNSTNIFMNGTNNTTPNLSEECQRNIKSLEDINTKNISSVKPLMGDKKNKMKNKKKKKNFNNKQRKRLDQVDVTQETTTTSTSTSTTTVPPTTSTTTISTMATSTTTDEILNEEDYLMENVTQKSWEDSTGLYDVSMTIEKTIAKNESARFISD